MALRDSFGAKIQIVNSEADLQTLVHAVDLQLTGGETPAFMWMLAGDSGEAASIGVTNGDGRKGNGEEGPKEQGDVPAGARGSRLRIFLKKYGLALATVASALVLRCDIETL